MIVESMEFMEDITNCDWKMHPDRLSLVCDHNFEVSYKLITAAYKGFDLDLLQSALIWLAAAHP